MLGLGYLSDKESVKLRGVGTRDLELDAAYSHEMDGMTRE